MFGIIKKLDLYVLKKFVALFVGAFCICIFILMMQFLWRYIDDLIGKGLTLDVLVKFFWYAGLTLVPMAIPLSVLLTSLISFGNMGEDMELTAMKSAGIPLKRILLPLIYTCILLTGVSFVFQNNISPNAQKQLSRMLVTMKETSPAIEIPEGIFYNGIPNVNLYVKHKEAKTGMLYSLIIYKMDQGFENAQIVVADSGRLETTADKHFLQLNIYSGEQFENLRSSSSEVNSSMHVPYDREDFKEKTLLIDFDSDFNMLDEELFNGNAKVKNITELVKGADSIHHACDSIGKGYYNSFIDKFMFYDVTKKDSLSAVARAKKQHLDIDKQFNELSNERKQNVLQQALNETQNIKTDLEWQKPLTESGYKDVRRHWIEWHQKFALSLACLLFLFIGAPLGAIIRKGGLGLPAVISVIIFVIYYIINTSGMKLARDGNIEVWLGMWISTFILAPFGLFFLYKANKDSVVFNGENYTKSIRRFFGIRTGRMFIKKEVVIDEPNVQQEVLILQSIQERCNHYSQQINLPHPPSYIKLFFQTQSDKEMENISKDLEACLQRLSNSQNAQLLVYMNSFPELFTHAHLSPFSKHGINIAIGIIVPLGLLLAWRIWRFRIILYRDIKTINKTNKNIQNLLQQQAQE